MSNKLMADEIIRAADPSCTLLNDLRIFDTIDSTNDYAKQIISQEPHHGCTIIADHQTAGKGRFGRSFYSPCSTGIYMSVILSSKSVHDAGLLTPIAALAVARSIEAIANVSASIKWVNDIYIGGKKICGILTEAQLAEGAPSFYVVGIGINVSTSDFPCELMDIAASLSGHDISRNLLIGRILSQLDKVVSDTDTGALMAEYKRRSCVIGKRILVLDKQPYTALAVDIDSEGRLMIVLENGTARVLSSGEISIKI